MRYGLQYVAVGGDVSDCPLAEPRAAQPEHVAAGFGAAIFLQPCLDLVVGEKSHVARMRHREDLPVAQQRRPRLEQPVARRTIFINTNSRRISDSTITIYTEK